MPLGMGIKHLVVAVSTIAAGLAIGSPTAQANFVPTSCAQGWVAETVVEGVGKLENLDSDGAGGFYVTGINDGFLAHVDASGRFEHLVTGLDNPAGVRVAGRSVYYLTGDGLDVPPGTLQRYDIDTGAVEVLLTGLNGPNGLLVLPDGDLLFTTLGIKGSPTGISRYRPSTGEYTKTWSALPLTNGLALAPDGRSVFTDSLELKVFRIPLDAPNSWTVVSGVPQLLALPDDMEATRDGQLFVADHALGAVYRIDTASGAACAIITGLIKPGPFRNPPDGATSVRIVRDGDGWVLYVTSMDGTLRRLRPPAGLDLTPADERRR
ncbi:SMP-30/gluconolactonase/LRE family protein [Nocardia lijiangensis]|uniref:Vgb family protein n=1 Tax=Nocardia lijiangensis TaxID=299618 RepID=UPI00082F1BDE|nr:SMP-30/gluconolactonase/LRE family protein [Nocardia lijiangensis]